MNHEMNKRHRTIKSKVAISLILVAIISGALLVYLFLNNISPLLKNNFYFLIEEQHKTIKYLTDKIADKNKSLVLESAQYFASLEEGSLEDYLKEYPPEEAKKMMEADYLIAQENAQKTFNFISNKLEGITAKEIEDNINSVKSIQDSHTRAMLSWVVVLFIILLTIIVIIYVLIISFVLNIIFIKPLKSFINRISTINYEKIDFDLPIVSDDEFGELTKAFNSMLHKLKDSTASIEELNKEIREKEKAQEESILLAKSLLNERDIFTQGHVVVFQWQNEPGWPVQYVSSNVENIFGYTPEEFTSRKISYADILYKEDIPRITEEANNAARNNIKYFYHQDYRVINKNGSIVWLNDFTSVIKDDSGAVTHYFGYVVDVTDRKNAEISLEEAKEYSETLFKLVPSAIFTVDTKQRITSWNRKTEEITGYNENEAIGKHCSFFAIEPCAVICGLYAEKIKKPVIGRECEIKTKAGEIKTISKNADILHDRDGNIIGGIESFEDITNKKQIEEELTKHRNHLKELVDEKTKEIESALSLLEIEVSDRKKISEELQLRLRYEKAITQCSQALLSDRPDSINYSLKLLLEATQASRIYIFKGIPKGDKDYSIEMTHEACSDGILSHLNSSLLNEITSKNGFEDWTEKLLNGEFIADNVINMEEKKRQCFKP